MNRIVCGALCGTLILGSALVASVVNAAPFVPVQRFSLSGQAGLGGIKMDDLNQHIDQANRFLVSRNWTAVDRISSAFSFKGDLRVSVVGPWMVSAGFTRSVASSGVDFDQVIDVKPSAAILRGTVSYQLPFWFNEKVRFALAGGTDYTTTAKLILTHEHRNVESGTVRIESLTYEGSGWGAHAMLEAELLVGESASLVGDAGWRQLKVQADSYSWKLERIPLPDGDTDNDDVLNAFDLSNDSFLRHGFLPSELLGSPGDIRSLEPTLPELDYSGFQANVGLRFYLF